MQINQLVSSTAFKLFIGIVLAAMMVISIFTLTQDLHLYLSKLVNGDLLQLGLFSFLLIISALGLYVLFMRNKPPKDLLLPLDFKLLGMNFLQGFITGFTKEHKQN